ncbi:hemolysin-III channel protein-like protein Izh2 [Biscogniauxia sp. FL1348]|nr:hemolysin-III channel protein-like protein Izh2 [Biscogniauxia sp. FL1348]
MIRVNLTTRTHHQEPKPHTLKRKGFSNGETSLPGDSRCFTLQMPSHKLLGLRNPSDRHGSDHLQTGYRRECASVWACFQSWTYIHNDTVNIYSHVIGTVIFMLTPLYVFGSEVPPRYKVSTTADILVCSTYFLGVAVCFTLSTLFHTFMSHSEPWYTTGIKFDYQGILLLMWGSTVPLVYYSFPCEAASSSGVRPAYWGATTALAALCSLATFHPAIGGPHLGHVRAALFGAFGFGSFLAPVAHGVLRFGLAAQRERVGLGWIGLTALCNGAGVVMYALKFPERWYPRRFDIWGASHQIMHVAVVFAALAYTKAVLQAFDYHHQYIESCTA